MTATTTGHGAVTREDITDLMDDHAETSAAPDLSTLKGLIQVTLDSHRWVWRGRHLVGIATDGTHRYLRGYRGCQHETITDWVTALRVMHGDGTPPAQATITSLLRAVEVVAKRRAEPDLATSGPELDLGEGEPEFRAGYPRLCVDSPARCMRAIMRAMQDRTIPDLYTRGGAITWIKEDDGRASIAPVGAVELRSHIQDYVDTYTEEKEQRRAVLAPSEVCSAIVARKDHNLPHLESIVTTPVLRPDGSLLQTPGYDPDTGLYYSPRHRHLPRVPEKPERETVEEARRFILDLLLSDFPWEADSDRAQYVGLMVTPIIRTMIPGPTPLGAISARQPASGKSLLMDVLSSMYGHSDMQWVDSEEEQRKAITAQLTEAAEPIVGIDNVPNGAAIGSHVWSTLFTKDTWRDRVLGATKTVTVPNDKLWIITGNNVAVTDDQASRTLWVRIDPRMADPAARTGFRVEEELTGGQYLGDWLKGSAENPDGNGWRVLSAVLTLVMDWVAAGCPTVEVRHRGYTRWASHIAGLLAHHGVHGFFADYKEQTRRTDQSVAQMVPFYRAWWETFGPSVVKSSELLSAAPLHEVIPCHRKTGERLSNAMQMTAHLKAFEGRFFGRWCARAVEEADTRTHTGGWRLEVDEEAD